MEKEYLYILKLKDKDFIKIGVSNFIYNRIFQHSITYSLDLCESYIISSENKKVPSLFEKSLLVDYHDKRDFSFKPKDGYTEILVSDCLSSIIEDIEFKKNKFPNHRIELIKGVELPDEIVSFESRWKELLFDMKVYGYYATGISTLSASINEFYEQLLELKSNDKSEVFNFDKEKSKLKLEWCDEFIRISKERAKLGIIWPFHLEYGYYQPLLIKLEEIEKIIRLDKVGLDQLCLAILGILCIVSIDEFPLPKYTKPKRPDIHEINMMKRTLSHSKKFIKWKDNINESICNQNLLDEFGDKLYDNDIE